MKPAFCLLTLLLLATTAFAQSDVVTLSSPSGCTVGQLSCGAGIDSVLPAASCLTACGENAELWMFRVFVQTTLVTLSVTSDDFDPRLDLFDAQWNLIASNDRVGGGTNARLAVVLEPGTYMVQVVGQPTGAAGTYRINLHCLLSDRKNFCIPDDKTLCLAGRFSFRVKATDPRGGAPIDATPRAQTELFGFFSFPSITGNADNPEVFVKLIDGRAVNGHWWVFRGGLTDFDYEVTVRDSFTKTEKKYRGAGEDTGGFGEP